MSTVTVAPTVEPSTGPGDPPRVRLDVTDTGTPAITSVTVVRRGPGGRDVPVRTTDGGPLTLVTSGSNRVGTVYDYELEYQVPVTYSTVQTPANTATVTLDEAQAWLIHLGVPALSRPISISAITGRAKSLPRAVHAPMGSKFRIVHSAGQRQASEYTLTVKTRSDADREALDALFEDGSTLLLNVPAGKGWGFTTEYVAIGDLNEDRPVPYGREPLRLWPLPLLVVERPIGGTKTERTYVDLLQFASYEELDAAYDSYLAIASGP